MITKTNYVDMLRNDHGMTKKEAGEVIDGLFSYMADMVGQDEVVQLQGIGTLRKAPRKAKTMRNIQTGDLMTIPAHKTCIFKVVGSFKKSLSQ